VRTIKRQFHIESLERREAPSALAPNLGRPAAGEVRVLDVAKIQTRVAQFGSATAAPGKTADVVVILGAVSRTGVAGPLSGTVKVYRGSTLIGSVSVGGVIATGGGDVYSKGTFKFTVPSNAARGSTIQLTLKYEGAQLYYPSQGTARVSVR
jgi:hypothetical protein